MAMESYQVLKKVTFKLYVNSYVHNNNKDKGEQFEGNFIAWQNFRVIPVL